MQFFEQYDEICKYFAKGKQRDANANDVKKQLQLHELSVGDFLTDMYALSFDFGMIDENILHRKGRGLEAPEDESPCRSRRKQERMKHLSRHTFT